jgi:hypothetical protein
MEGAISLKSNGIFCPILVMEEYIENWLSLASVSISRYLNIAVSFILQKR